MLELSHKVFDRHPGLLQDAVQRPDSQLAVQRDDTSDRAVRRLLLQDDVTSPLADLLKSQPLQSADCRGAGYAGSTTGTRGQPSHCFWSSKKAWEGRPRRLGKMGGLGTL